MKVSTAVILSVLTMGLCLCPAPAAAQLSRVGSSQGVLIPPSTVRGTDVGYDPVNDVYLLIGANGFMGGVFTDAAGAIVPGTSQFAIGSAAGGANNIYAAFPRATYSPDINNGAGGFLVTWHQNDGKPNHVHTAVVAYPTGVIAGDKTISDDTQGGSFWEAGGAVAYSVTSRKFLVAWQALGGGWVQGRFVNLDGSGSGGIMTFENGCSRDPGVTWNSTTDEFGVINSSYCGGTSAGAFVAFRRVSASTGAISSRTTTGYTSGTFITDVVYNPLTNHYLLGWGTAGGGNYAEVDENGNVLGGGAFGLGTYDSLGIAFNQASGTMLMTAMGNSAEVLGLETNGKGVPITSQMVMTNGGGSRGSFYPRVATRKGQRQWAISYARQFTVGTIQIIATTSALGGPVSTIQMAVDSPGAGTLYRTTDTIPLNGWVVDRGASSGTGVDALHIYAFPNAGGPPTFLASVTAFTSRTDVGGLLGTQFSNSGFSASASGLPAGTYTINFYPHSTVTNAYATPKSITVTVASALPLMSLDTPSSGATVSSGGFTVAGWALDRYAPSGTGVDAVHVWAFQTGGPPTFVGAATLGGNRPDVGAVFGAQFNASGYTLSGTLLAGTYQLVAYMHDTVTGTFNLSATANIKVAAATPAPFMSLDAPGAGLVALGTNIGGWAIDTGASTGTGVGGVHVYAFPVGGGSPVFVGAATLGFSRPDVGAIFGSRFTSAGYNLTLTGLTPGQQYDLGVFAHSTVTGTFNQSKTVRITVQ